MFFARHIALAMFAAGLATAGHARAASGPPIGAGGMRASCTALATSASAAVESDIVPAGPSGYPATPGIEPSNLPVYCRVSGTLHPVPGSSIGFQLWLPARGQWTGRLQMFGNGGYSSQQPLPQMVAALIRGSAVVATDTGHQGDDPDFAIGHPQAIIDWGSRAVHESAVEAKRLVARFYARPPVHSYFDGCSTGGHQALMEAQRFPADFDGIVAGAPGSDRIRLNAGFLWQFLANHRHGDDLHPILGRDDLDLLGDASFAACHAANGGRAGGLAADTWLDDPTQCRFDPAVLACKPGQHQACFGPEQVAAARKMYRGALDPRSGEAVTTPWLPGSEPGWFSYWADPQHPNRPARLSFWRIWAFDDPQWNWWQFDFGADLDRIRARLSPMIDATDPDLVAFRARGGKLLQYHGLADPVVPPLTSIDYFEAVQQRLGDTASWYRLFLVPGMNHCGGGPGFTHFDAEAAIERWVEHRTPPARIVARQGDGPTGATRPLCPYPTHAVHADGPMSAAGSFICRAQLSEKKGNST